MYPYENRSEVKEHRIYYLIQVIEHHYLPMKLVIEVPRIVLFNLEQKIIFSFTIYDENECHVLRSTVPDVCNDCTTAHIN